MLKIEHLSKTYRTGTNEYPVLKDLSFLNEVIFLISKPIFILGYF